MRFIELFAGIGGFRYGLEKASVKIQQGKQKEQKREDRNNLPLGRCSRSIKRNDWQPKKLYQCVYANEWDYDPYKKEKQYAWKIYQKQFGKGELDTRNIEDVPVESIPDHDLLTAGFPCQRFSIAGKRTGMSGEDTKGSEFYEVYRIAKERHPQLLLLENVPGLFSSRGGEDFYTILKSLDEIGYDVEWDCINTSVFLPQNRLRVFIVGHLRGKGGQKVFPIGETMRENNASGKRQTSGCINEGEGRNQNTNTYLIYWKNSKEKWVKENRNCTTVIKTQSDLCRRPLIEDYIQNPKLRDYKKSKTASALISSQYKEPQVINGIRRLTPTECERLQGFPDGWTEGISDSQRYRCLGNAVTTNVVEEIGKRIIKVQKDIF